MAKRVVTITAYNSGINTVEVGGVFWIGRTETTREVPAEREQEVREHPLLEVKDDGLTGPVTVPPSV